MSPVQPPKQPPPMTKGTLLVTAKKTHVFAKISPSPRLGDTAYVGSVKKGSQVMSLGEFVTLGKKTWIKVLSPVGTGWIRVGNIVRESPV